MRINFIIAGIQKGGTTALRMFLREHKDIYMPKEEGHFFDHLHTTYDKYHKLFKNRKNSSLLGECTPIYMFWPGSMEKIQLYNPNIKIICLLRNPIDRAYSHYRMELRRGIETKFFKEALVFEEKKLKKISDSRRYYSYIARGMYSWQIERIYKLFPKNNVLFIKSEDLLSDHDETLEVIFNFLEIDNMIIKQQIFRKGNYKAMTNENRQYLYDIFKEDIEKVERLLDWDLSEWKN